MLKLVRFDFSCYSDRNHSVGFALDRLALCEDDVRSTYVGVLVPAGVELTESGLEAFDSEELAKDTSIGRFVTLEKMSRVNGVSASAVRGLLIGEEFNSLSGVQLVV